MFIKMFQKGEEQMKKKFLIVSLATMLCLVSLTTVNAAPAESPAPAVYTTAATPTDFALMKQLFNAEEYAEMYPEYGFEGHKGYGSAAHIEAIKKYGPCPIHRLTFIKNFM